MTITIQNVDESFLPAFAKLARSAKAKIKIEKSQAQQWQDEAGQAVADFRAGKKRGYSSASEMFKDIVGE